MAEVTAAIPGARSDSAAHVARELAADRERIESELQSLLPLRPHTHSVIGDAMAYAVLGAGGRVRPLLALRVARLVRAEARVALRAAAAVELLHCASLVLDDLPCMDNEDVRRGRPATHAAFGESTAILAAFGLVSLAARCVVEQPCPTELLPRLYHFQSTLLRTLDCNGLIEGQVLDLRHPNARAGERARINELKTVPLFRLAVLAGSAFGDRDPERTASLQRFGDEFGRAFQVADDLDDGDAASESALDHSLMRARRELAALSDDGGLTSFLELLHARRKHKANRRNR